MDSYYDYLAVQVLNEKEIVTYRSVSRALKVHVNLAKQMLWDFHHRENARQSGTVHATYLLSGYRKSDSTTSAYSSQRKDGDDMIMDSSPPLPGSSMPVSDSLPEMQQVVQKSIVLAKQENLEAAKDTFADITSIHVYSLEAKGLDDMQLLTECTRKVLSTLRTDDLMVSGKEYGLIQNPDVKRRTRKTPLPPASAAKATAPATKKDTATTDANKAPVAAHPIAKAAVASKPPLLKKSSSGIAASFAKGANKPKPAAKAVPPTPDADAAMGGMSDDDDGDEEDDVEDRPIEIDIKAPSGKSKKDRQAELEAMMEVDDEVVDDIPEEPSEPIEETPAPVKEEPKESVVVENGRRRGRRRAMKKRTVRDEEGYLVTKEEAVWESFSEDEPVLKKAKTSAAPPAAAAATATAKKGAKPGQGNIMSFFSKK